MDEEDIGELVSFLTPRQTTDDIGIYQNTTAIACPSCGDPFDSLVVCRAEFNELELSKPLDICTTVHEGNAVLFTHEKPAPDVESRER